MVLAHIDLKYVSLIYRKIRQNVPNGKGFINNVMQCKTIVDYFSSQTQCKTL